MKTQLIRRLLLFSICMFPMLQQAQEYNLPLHSQYMGDSYFLLSPAFAGLGDNIRVRLSGVTQWVGVKNAPDTQSIAADGRISDRSAVGLIVFNDKNGNTKQFGGQLSFAHHLTLSQHPDRFLSFGASYKFTQFRIDLNDINDDIYAAEKDLSENNSNFDLSVLYRHNRFYASLNAINILPKKLKVLSDSEPRNLRNYYLYSGYVFRKGRYHMEYEPSILFQYLESDGRSTTDINMKVRKIQDIEDYMWAGISYRFLNDQLLKPLALIPMVGIKKNNFYVAYGFQFNMNTIQGFTRGTHMVTLGMDFMQGISACRCSISPNMR
ncbi:MAG: type IX secretion system membrane protein PorP/SprF [Flavobacteriaceae bacterium]|nr:type IX secretion system membrane protein PorP/SprF [Flavobacteriaceae bacterium]